MTWLDYAVLGVLVLSALWGAWRGFVRVILWAAGWVIASLTAYLFAGPVAARLPASWVPADFPQLKLILAFAAVFFLTLIATSLVALLLSKLVHAAGLAGTDRAIGAVVGLAPGILIIVAFTLVAGLTPLPRSPEWKESASGPALAALARRMKPWLPPALGDSLSYD
jgi:membrane protein required for colicin V production